jgi:phosphatidylinositol alpha-mannosyltransferase
VLVEAMACGCPVVASDIRGYREASNGAAILAPPSDAKALANALQLLAGDHNLKQQAIVHGARRAQELSWTSLAGEVISVYEAAMAGDAVYAASAPPLAVRETA